MKATIDLTMVYEDVSPQGVKSLVDDLIDIAADHASEYTVHVDHHDDVIDVEIAEADQ